MTLFPFTSAINGVFPTSPSFLPTSPVLPTSPLRTGKFRLGISKNKDVANFTAPFDASLMILNVCQESRNHNM